MQQANLRRRAALLVVSLGLGWVAACSEGGDAKPADAGTGGSGGAPDAPGGEGGAAPEQTCPTVLGASEVEKTATGCVDGSCFGCAYPVDAMPFIQGAYAVTDDLGSIATIATQPGKVCMNGTSVGWSVLVLQLGGFMGQPGPPSGQEIPFDAAALSVTEVELTIDSPPQSGVVPGVSGPVRKSDCLCSEVMVFDFPSGAVTPGSEPSETVVAPLTDLEKDGYAFSPSAWLGLELRLGAEQSYDFCVGDIEMRDDTGAEVSPPTP